MADISKITLPNGDSYDIKDKLARQKILYGEIDSTSTATVLTATVEGFTELVDDTCCLIYNNVITSASGWTLNVNNTGALPVYVMQDNGRSTTGYAKTRTCLFVYSQTRVSGGCWLMGYFDADTDTNSNTIGYYIRPSGYLKAKDAFYRYRLLFQVDDTYVMPSNTSTATKANTKKAINQRAFDPFGQVFMYYGTSNYAVDSVLGTTNWYQYSANIGYAFNHNGAAATMTANKSVYLKLRPVSDGKVKFYGWAKVESPSGNPSSLEYYEYDVTNDEYVVSTDTSVVSTKTYYQIDKSYTQELPSSDDGLLYMRLGVATSATELNLQIYHPIYYYSNGAIRLWTNSDGIPAPSSPSSGQVLMYNNGSWQAMYQDKSLQLPYQIIPLSFDGSDFSTTITPQDIAEGYTVNNNDYPPYNRSSFTKADLLGQMSILLTPILGNTDGYEFQSSIFALDSFGWTGEIGLLRIETNAGYQNPYSITLVKWPAGLPNPTDFVEDASACIYSLSSSVNQGGQTILHLDEEFTEISAMVQTGRKVLFIWPSFGYYAFFELVYSSQYDETITLYSCSMYSNGIVTLSSDQNGGMTGTLQNVSTGEGKIDEPASSNVGDVLSYTANGWSSVAISTLTGNLVTSISSSSTDAQYPSAKCMYDIIGDVETLLAAI